MTNHWLLPSNSKVYDVEGALEAFDEQIDWTKRNNISNGDIIYLYESHPTQAVIAKLMVEDNAITKDTKLEDDKFWKEGNKSVAENYFRMNLLGFLSSPLSLEWLKENGLKSNLQSAEKIKPELLKKIKEKESKMQLEPVSLKAEGLLETVIKAKEGKKVQIYTYRYERSPKLRKQAIDIHGRTCKVCGFDFKKTYGKIGEGFIEVHHIKPLSSYDEEVEIEAAHDLITICSNCHRMIHRRKNVLSVEELQKEMGNLFRLDTL